MCCLPQNDLETSYPEKWASQSTEVCTGKSSPAWPRCYIPPLRTLQQLCASASWYTQKGERAGCTKNGTKCPNPSCLVLQQIYVLLCCYKSHGPVNPREQLDFSLISSSFLSSAESWICCTGRSWDRPHRHSLDSGAQIVPCGYIRTSNRDGTKTQSVVPWLSGASHKMLGHNKATSARNCFPNR